MRDGDFSNTASFANLSNGTVPFVNAIPSTLWTARTSRRI